LAENATQIAFGCGHKRKALRNCRLDEIRPCNVAFLTRTAIVTVKSNTFHGSVQYRVKESAHFKRISPKKISSVTVSIISRASTRLGTALSTKSACTAIRIALRITMNEMKTEK